MTPQAVITIGLVLIVVPAVGIVICTIIEKRRETKQKRLACLQDPVVVRQIFSR